MPRDKGNEREFGAKQALTVVIASVFKYAGDAVFSNETAFKKAEEFIADAETRYGTIPEE